MGIFTITVLGFQVPISFILGWNTFLVLSFGNLYFENRLFVVLTSKIKSARANVFRDIASCKTKELSHLYDTIQGVTESLANLQSQ